MERRPPRARLGAVLAAAAALVSCGREDRRAAPELVAAAFERPLPPPEGPLRVYHLGHSLVGRDVPAMLEQLAPTGHRHESQLGWGASLRDHFEPDVPVAGFETENDHPRFRPAREAVGSGEYDAVVLTEMVELEDALRHHDGARYLHAWAELARAASPHTRLYLFETWHRLDDPRGFLERIDLDLERLWLRRLADPDLVAAGPTRPVWLVPGGQVLAAFVREVEAAGGVEGVAGRADLFARAADGAVDPIHLNDLGAYLMALTHYAALYGRSPVGLPHELARADGSPAEAPSPAAARLMQEVVWRVVRAHPRTGVAP